MELIKWNDYVKNNPTCNFNSQTHWIDYFESLGYKNLSFFITDEEEKLVGIFPLFKVQSLFFGTKLISSPFLDNGGLFCDLDNDEKNFIYDRIIELGKIEHADYIEIRNPFDTDIIEKWQVNNEYCDFEFRLDSEEWMWNVIDKKLRNIIRKSEKDLTWTMKSIDDGIDVFYYLYLKSMQHLRSPPLPKSFYQNFKKDNSFFLFAMHKEKIIAGILINDFQDKVKYEAYVYNPKYKNLNANSLLVWNAMKICANAGSKLFYFGRTLKNSSVYEYKKQWNAVELDYTFFYYLFKGKIPTDIRKGWIKKLNIIWKICPTFITSKIGFIFRKMVGS